MNNNDASIKKTISIAVYKEDQWERLQDISEDHEDLEKTYNEWKTLITKKIKEYESQGFKIHKIEIDTEEMLAWCNLNRLSVNSKSRSRYMSAKIRELSKESS